jgi:succinate dehydrogenase/fumarate reductase flavoprotein subunit
MARKESRGLHYTIDHPEHDDALWSRDSLIRSDDVQPALPSPA